MGDVHQLTASFPFVEPNCAIIPEEISTMVTLACLGAANSVVGFEGAEAAGIPRIEVVRCLSEFGREPECFFVA